MSSLNKTIYTTSLGCAKNLVDSERFLSSTMRNMGFSATDQGETADLILVNTCAFLQSAVEEAIDTIISLGQLKKEGAKLVVMGCLPARYQGPEGRDMAQNLGEVDLWLSPGEYGEFEKRVGELLACPSSGETTAFEAGGSPLGERILGTPFYRAFLKIAEGCDNHCTYCLIPALRGPLTSQGKDKLLAEATTLADGGVRELTLVAQDLTAYGRDLPAYTQDLPAYAQDKKISQPSAHSQELVELVSELAKIPSLQWIRLLYAYPESLTEELVKSLAAIPKVLPYLDLPFQHSSPEILRRMGRRSQATLKLVKNLRKWWPGIALRTTVMVGFPGETDEHFQELLDFVTQAEFDHLGTFKFSPEAGTPAASFPKQVPQGVKEKRRRKIMSVQRRISLAHNRNRVGQVVEVLVEGPSADSPLVQSGRAFFQAPEVDGLIYFDGEQPQAGELVQTRIIKAYAYDLIGSLLDGSCEN